MGKTAAEIARENRIKGRDFERQIFNKIAPGCDFAANFGGNATSESTPDLVCLQTGEYDKVRFIEAKYNGYIEPDQRDTLAELIEEADDYTQWEVYYRPSPRKVKKRILKKRDGDRERAREILEEEFNHKKLEEP